MILHKETFKKYGYQSKDLSKGSQKKVVAKCDSCGKIYDLRYYAANTNMTGFCKKCAIRIFTTSKSIEKNIKKTKIKTSELFKTYKSNDFNIKNCYELLFRLRVASSKRTNHRHLVSLSHKCITLEDSIKILSSVGFEEFPQTTDEMRNHLMLNKLKLKTVLELINMYFKKFPPRLSSKNDSITYARYHRSFRKLLKIHPYFKYKQIKDGAIKITRGSFIANGQWVDINPPWEREEFNENPLDIDFNSFDQPNLNIV